MLPTLKIQKKVKEDETYHCNWVERILNRQQENFIPTRWVISVPWPSDPLACGVVEEGLLPSNVHRFICCKCHTFLCTFHVFELHQSLALERHHHDIAGEGNIVLNFPAHSKQLPGPMMLIYDVFFQTILNKDIPYGSKLLQSFHEICFHHWFTQPSDMDDRRNRHFVMTSPGILATKWHFKIQHRARNTAIIN